MCAIPVPFDPKAVFGKVRAPVKVTVNGYTFRSTIARMGGVTFIPLRKSNREAAAVAAGDRVTVRIAADADARVVEVPPDPATHSLVWRSIATEDEPNPAKLAEKLDDMVKKAVEKYPPKKK